MGKAKYVEGSAITMPAGSDLSGSQYYCVKNDGSGGAILAALATDKIIGTIKRPPPTGWTTGSNFSAVEIFPRSASGTILGVAGGTITVGAAVTSNSSGTLVVTTTAGDQIVGQYNGAASAASGDVIEIMPMT